MKILDVSKKLFYDIGYDNTSTKMIAKEVGIAEGTIFNYFDSKSEIFFEVFFLDSIEPFSEDSLVDSVGDVSKIICDHILKASVKIHI